MLKERSCSVAVIGLAHSGKSALYEQILSRPEASPGPARANDIKCVIIHKGLSIKFVEVSLTRAGSESGGFQLGSEEAPLKDAEIVLFITDASRAISQEEGRIAKEIGALEAKRMLVLNKVDLLDETELDAQLEVGKHLGQFDFAVAVSALSGKGVDRLLKKVILLAKETVSSAH